MTTRWQQHELSRLGRRMVRLERIARRADLLGKDQHAAAVWEQREATQWMRSLLLRDIWAQQHQWDELLPPRNVPR